MRSLLAAGALALVSLVASEARAQDTAVVGAPAFSVRAGEISCTVTDLGGIPEADAHTAADLICGELAEKASPPEPYEIRFGKLDANVLVTVTRVNRRSTRRIMLSSIAEITVAAPRLAVALVADKPLAETEKADNVVAAEARRPTTKNGTLAGVGELFGATHTGSDPGLSGGVGAGLDFRLDDVAIGIRGRLGGIGDADDKLALATLDVGVRWYPMDGATSPYVGGGIVVGHYKAIHDRSGDLGGSGFGAFAEVGLDFLRNAKVGIFTALRADAPFYSLDGSGGRSTYVVPLSFNVGLAFR